MCRGPGAAAGQWLRSRGRPGPGQPCQCRRRLDSLDWAGPWLRESSDRLGGLRACTAAVTFGVLTGATFKVILNANNGAKVAWNHYVRLNRATTAVSMMMLLRIFPLSILHWKRRVSLHLKVFLTCDKLKLNVIGNLSNYYFIMMFDYCCRKLWSDSELKKNQKSSTMQQAALWQRRPQKRVG